MSILETETLPFDPTPLMAEGELAASPSSQLVNLDTQAVVALADAPQIPSSNVITQTIIGGTDVAEPGNYRLTVTFTATPSANVRALQLLLTVTP
jgi:hypothetical protein